MSVAMETVSSFSSRRPAAGALPAFSLPPPTSDIPSMLLVLIPPPEYRLDVLNVT